MPTEVNAPVVVIAPEVLITTSFAKSPAAIVASTIFAAVMLLSGMSALVKGATAPGLPKYAIMYSLNKIILYSWNLPCLIEL